MSLENCYPIIRLGDELTFIFTSENSDGLNPITKIITYAIIQSMNKWYYNLGFGDYNPDLDHPDDIAISNNGDMRKILRTVASTLVIFFNEHPHETVRISGSDSIRNNYYHKLAKDYSHLISRHYIIRGSKNDLIEPFQDGKQYDFLLINLKTD